METKKEADDNDQKSTVNFEASRNMVLLKIDFKIPPGHL